MRVLVISRGAWNSMNNTGNTMQNFFGDCDELELHNLYLRSELPGDNPCKTIFKISEKDLVLNIKNRKKLPGSEVLERSSFEKDAEQERKLYNKVKTSNSYLLWIARELLWSFSKWKNKKLDEYLEKIKPRVIFMPVFGCWYPHKILKYVKNKTGAKVILFHADDNFSLKQFSLSPAYWIHRLRLRHWVRKSVKASDANFCISNLQVEEYSRAFGVECRLLQKFISGAEDIKYKGTAHPLRMVYTGNLEMNRWKTLSLIAEALEEINENEVKATMDIYSATVPSEKMLKSFNHIGVEFKGSVPSSEIKKIQSSADILIHAEAFDSINKLRVRQSFSTKIIDYLSQKRCVLAIGPSDIASIDYFIRNDIGYVIDDNKNVKDKLVYIIDNEKERRNLADKAYNYVLNNNGPNKKREFIENFLRLD